MREQAFTNTFGTELITFTNTFRFSLNTFRKSLNAEHVQILNTFRSEHVQIVQIALGREMPMNIPGYMPTGIPMGILSCESEHVQKFISEHVQNLNMFRKSGH